MITKPTSSLKTLVSQYTEAQKNDADCGMALANMIFCMRDLDQGLLTRWHVNYGRNGFVYCFKKGMNKEIGEGRDAATGNFYVLLGALISNYSVRFVEDKRLKCPDTSVLQEGASGKSKPLKRPPSLLRIGNAGPVYFGSSIVLNELFADELANTPMAPLPVDELETRGKRYFSVLRTAMSG